jgi:mediator of RNA polymerase II transcription subunit 8
MASEREQKQLEAGTEALGNRLNDVRKALGQLIVKVETDPTLNWHSFLDSYALITGEMNSLLRQMRNEKTPILKKYITLPLILSPDRDEELLKLTEHRVPTFSHDLIPNYLRTRPDPEIEAKYSAVENRASGFSQDQQQKQITAIEKITRDTLKLIKRERDEMETKSNSRPEVEITYNNEDTMNLLAAINNGKGLKTVTPVTTARQSPVPVSQQMHNIKAPSTIKTNIKAANSAHPYQRQQHN